MQLVGCPQTWDSAKKCVRVKALHHCTGKSLSQLFSCDDVVFLGSVDQRSTKGEELSTGLLGLL